MGQYLNGGTLGARHKAEALITRYGAVEVAYRDLPLFADIPSDQVLVCVAESGMFDAAAVMYSQDEYEDWTQTARTDRRPMTWLLIPKDKIKGLLDGEV